MLYHGKKFDNLYDVEEYIVGLARNEAWVATEKEGVMPSWYDDFECDYVDNALAEFERSRKNSITIESTKGPVEGWFVGSVECAVDGDAETGWETDLFPAFKTKSGHVFMAYELNNGKYWLFNPNKHGGKIRWDVYPEYWPAEKTRPFSVSAPKALPLPNELQDSDLVDDPWCTDRGDFLYVIRPYLGYIATGPIFASPVYVGHSRTQAAHEMKEARNNGLNIDITVYPIHRQDEYDELPF